MATTSWSQVKLLAAARPCLPPASGRAWVVPEKDQAFLSPAHGSCDKSLQRKPSAAQTPNCTPEGRRYDLRSASPWPACYCLCTAGGSHPQQLTLPTIGPAVLRLWQRPGRPRKEVHCSILGSAVWPGQPPAAPEPLQWAPHPPTTLVTTWACAAGPSKAIQLPQQKFRPQT